jgi:hypothetical protein
MGIRFSVRLENRASTRDTILRTSLCTNPHTNPHTIWCTVAQGGQKRHFPEFQGKTYVFWKIRPCPIKNGNRHRFVWQGRFFIIPPIMEFNFLWNCAAEQVLKLSQCSYKLSTEPARSVCIYNLDFHRQYWKHYYTYYILCAKIEFIQVWFKVYNLPRHNESD